MQFTSCFYNFHIVFINKKSRLKHDIQTIGMRIEKTTLVIILIDFGFYTGINFFSIHKFYIVKKYLKCIQITCKKTICENNSKGI
jgi:hypothetical protein